MNSEPVFFRRWLLALPFWTRWSIQMLTLLAVIASTANTEHPVVLFGGYYEAVMAGCWALMIILWLLKIGSADETRAEFAALKARRKRSNT